ncbi:MAG TPA: hypothetical protein VK154_19920 [Chitinophagales bacterium]|nr:hypothetical protein [Chitinophagales bacterium]
MKKAMFMLLALAALSSCKKYYYTCTDSNGQVMAEKAFFTEAARDNYAASQVGKPDSELCQ